MFPGKLRTIIVVAITSLSICVATASAQQNTRELFERARMLDESNQNLSEAIKLYSQVVSQSNEQRALAARAQYRIGALYERLGRKAEAQRAFQTVVRQYADQPEASRARAKLPAAFAKANAGKSRTAGNEATAMITRQAWSGPDVDTGGAPSPDGRYLSFLLLGNVAVRDLATGEVRRLTNIPPGANEEADEAIWSPDGKQLAYTVWNCKAKCIEELRVIGLDGSKPRVLYHNKDTNGNYLCGWSPDGKYILTVLEQRDHTRQLARVAVSDGSVQVIKKLEGPFVRPRLSPDGRYLVYDVAVQKDSSRRDIFLLSADGSPDIPLIQHAADDQVLGWAPDGKTILFASDRSGTWDAWIISVVEGKVQGSPERIKREIGQVQPMGFTRNGSFYYSVSTGLLIDIYIATLSPETGQLIGAPVLAKTRFTGSNGGPGGPDWSPDGRYLVYRSFRGRNPGDPSGDHQIFILNPETGEEREVRSKLKRFNAPRWFSDGKSLFVRDWTGTAGRTGGGLFKIDSETGDATLFAPDLFQPVLSPDAKAIFYQNKKVIWRRDLETGEDKDIYRPTPPTEGQGTGVTESIALSPDGQRLAFLFRQSLFVIPATGGDARELLKLRETEAFERDPSNVAWTPDGRYLLFAKRGDKKPELWRIPADGGEPQQLGQLMGRVSGLRVHPDGQHIAFCVQQWNKGEVWVMENFLAKQNPKEQSRSTIGKRR